jgi:hypothetical protein
VLPASGATQPLKNAVNIMTGRINKQKKFFMALWGQGYYSALMAWSNVCQPMAA